MTKDKTSQKLNEGGEKPVSLPPKVKGNLVSGRVWKHQQTTSKKIVKPNRKKGWAKIQEERNRRQNLLLREQALKEEEKRKKEVSLCSVFSFLSSVKLGPTLPLRKKLSD